jgi:hypothetical protein
MGMRPPCRHLKNIVAGLGLRLRGDREQVLVALARDVVDGDFAFCFSAHSLQRSVEALLAPGTQWSQKPIESFPAA